MSRLLRRIKRAPRDSTDELPPRPSATAASAAAAHDPSAEPGSGAPLLAGQDPDDSRPTALRRGRLRKRLRYLERERELLLRDLGGLVYEIHRSGVSSEREHHRALVSGKVQRLAALDQEHGSGLATLGETRADTVLREPGVGGACPDCGELFGSDAHFCSACGTAVTSAQASTSEPPAITTPPETSDLVLPARPGATAAVGTPTTPTAAVKEPAAAAGANRTEPATDDATRIGRPAPGGTDEALTEIAPPRITPPGHSGP